MSLPASAPLEGIRVLDMADEKGELCGRLLADLGADVVRVEPLDGATSRRLPPFAPDGTSSLYFAFRNANKRGITLDPSETLANEHTLARGTFRTLEILPGVEAQVASGLYEIDGERMGPRERAPRVGEHNQEVYTALGVSAGELDDLRSQGVI